MPFTECSDFSFILDLCNFQFSRKCNCHCLIINWIPCRNSFSTTRTHADKVDLNGCRMCRDAVKQRGKGGKVDVEVIAPLSLSCMRCDGDKNCKLKNIMFLNNIVFMPTDWVFGWFGAGAREEVASYRRRRSSAHLNNSFPKLNNDLSRRVSRALGVSI